MEVIAPRNLPRGDYDATRDINLVPFNLNVLTGLDPIAAHSNIIITVAAVVFHQAAGGSQRKSIISCAANEAFDACPREV